MAKTPTKKKPRPQPGATQLQALQRLMRTGHYALAIERARALVERFPGHGGAQRFLVEALAAGQGQAAAALAAYGWAQRQPNSLPAQDTLLRLAFQGGYFFLADQVAARVRDLGGTTPGFPLEMAAPAELLLQPDGSMGTAQDQARFDLGKLHLEAGDFAGAVQVLEGVAITPARNNRGLSQFHLGRIDEALAAFLDAWQADPGNLFGLSWALQLRLWRGDRDSAQGLAVPLAKTRARRPEDAQTQLTGLLLLREDQAAWDAFEQSRGADWAGHETGPIKATWLHLGACAASRLGLANQAGPLWRKALAEHPGLRRADVNLGRLKGDGVPPAWPELFDLGQALPVGWIRAVQEGGATGVDERFDELTASDAYLEAIYLGGDEVVREFATFVLKRRLTHRPPAAGAAGDRDPAAILRDLARLPIGRSQDRLGLLGTLREQGLMAPGEAAEFWSGNGLKQVAATNTEIYRGPEPSDLPADLHALLGESIDLQREGRLAEAESALHAILARIPDQRIALGNLAGIRAAQGRMGEAKDMLRRLVALHPDYLFGRCNLASILIRDGALDEAQAQLAGLVERPRLHISEVFVLYGTTAMLYRARGEDDAANALIANLEGMVENEGDALLLANAKAKVARATAGGRFFGALKAAVRSLPKPGRPKRR